MTFEDYVYSLDGTNGILGALGNSYLDEDEISRTMTKYTIGGVTNKTWDTYHQEPSHIEHDWCGITDYGKGVRPVIYLSSKLMVEENKESNYGTLHNPYCLISELKYTNGDNLNSVTIGSYIYLSEENNLYITPTENVTSRLNYSYDKTKVRYRVIGISNDGSIKVQRSDVLRNLPNTIAMNGGLYIPYYYKQNTCDFEVGVYSECINHNHFKPTEGSGAYAYTESENIGYYLNNATNSYYNWFSDKVKSSIVTTNWNLPIGGYAKDYSESLFNTNYTGIYPNRSNDGIVEAKIGLPQWGDMFTGNDLNINYWYINRWPGSSTSISFIRSHGYVTNATSSNSYVSIRPVLNLHYNIKINGGDGTPANPYTLSI